MIGNTFSTPSPGSSASVSPGRSSPSAAMTVWWVPLMTWGVIPKEVICATMWPIWSAVASAFMTTITLARPSASRFWNRELNKRNRPETCRFRQIPGRCVLLSFRERLTPHAKPGDLSAAR